MYQFYMFQAIAPWCVLPGDSKDYGDRFIQGTGGSAGAVLHDGTPRVVPARLRNPEHPVHPGHQEAAVPIHCEDGTSHGYCFWYSF